MWGMCGYVVRAVQEDPDSQDPPDMYVGHVWLCSQEPLDMHVIVMTVQEDPDSRDPLDIYGM